jgi:hypothetical protein
MRSMVDGAYDRLAPPARLTGHLSRKRGGATAFDVKPCWILDPDLPRLSGL